MKAGHGPGGVLLRFVAGRLDQQIAHNTYRFPLKLAGLCNVAGSREYLWRTLEKKDEQGAKLKQACVETDMQESQPKPSRRGFFFGAAASGAAAAVIVALPGAPSIEAALEVPKPAPEKGGGYSLSEHVKRYYKTTRL